MTSTYHHSVEAYYKSAFQICKSLFVLQKKRLLGAEPNQNLAPSLFLNCYLQSAKQPDSQDRKEMCIV